MATLIKLPLVSAIFSMDFSNQIVNQSLAAGVTKANGGKSLHQGVELALRIFGSRGYRAVPVFSSLVLDGIFYINIY